MNLEKETLGFWEQLIKIIEKYGYWKLTKVVMFVVFTITMLYLGKNFGENYSFEEHKEIISRVMAENSEEQFELHKEEMEKRRQIKPDVSELLKNTLSEMNADRAFVIELHNGSSNTSGLPFVHCSMTYEEDAMDVESVDEDYQNITLSRFNLPEYLHKHSLWFGDMTEFSKIDKKASIRLRQNNVSYLVIATIKSDNNEIGYFGFTYCNGSEHKGNKEMMEYMVHAIQKLSKWLDKDLTDT